MGIRDEYKKIPHELSGAVSKNRFCLEMLWGASKMFDLFDVEDFCVVFDYKCDIEIHLPNSLEFYQIKTHKIQSPYSLKKLTKQDKTNKSIIGKLFLLKNAVDPSALCKVAVVSNAYLKINNKTYSEYEELEFDSLDSKTQKVICNALSAELGPEIDLKNIGFIYTSMNLLNPDNDLRGKIVGSFEKIMGCEPQKPNALYRLIKETVENKACYEMVSNTYDELIQNKGITKKDLQNMLDKHSSITDNMQIAVNDIERKIEKQEQEYKKWLEELKKYEASIAEKHGEIDDVLAHKGFIEIRDEIIEELHALKEKTEDLITMEKQLKKEERAYIEIKNKINTRYYELMLHAKNQFHLEEIKENSFKNIVNTFKGGGSNKPIATVIWYLNLLKLKKEFNPSAIDFPVVFDSPNNAETDLEKKGQLYKYIVENVSKDIQLIVSGIGYENEETFGISFDNVIRLTNEKYQLLCAEDYSSYSDLLFELCSK